MKGLRMGRTSWVGVGVLLAGALLLDARQAPSNSAGIYVLANGSYAVGAVDDLVLHDGTRNKDLHIKIFYPEAAGPFPIIVFSHGAGGSKDGYAGLTRFWAEHGYVTIQPTHADSLKKLREQGKVGGLGSVREMVYDPEAWANRVRDLTFILDSLGELARRVPQLGGKLDTRRIGVGGHSYGAYTTMLVGGMTMDVSGGTKAQSYADPRPRAFLVLSGQGRDKRGLTEHSWEKFTRPMMNITGSLDRGISGQDSSWREEPYEFSPPGDKYQVFVQGANHMTFTGLPAEMGRQPEALFDIARIASVAFWDAYLKESKNAKAYLASDALETYSRGAARLERK